MNQHPLRHLAYIALLAALVTPATVRAQAKGAPPIDGVIGKLQSFDGKTLDVGTPSGVVHVIVKQPLTTYKQIPSDLSHVAAAPYIGVASAEGAGRKASGEADLHISCGAAWGCGRQCPDGPSGCNLPQQNDQRHSLSPFALAHDERNSPEERWYHARG